MDKTGGLTMELISRKALKESMEKAWISTRLVDEAPTIEPLHAAGGCYCAECQYKDTNACPAYDAPMRRTSLRMSGCLTGKAKEGAHV